jgi:hypothetical protein
MDQFILATKYLMDKTLEALEMQNPSQISQNLERLCQKEPFLENKEFSLQDAYWNHYSTWVSLECPNCHDIRDIEIGISYNTDDGYRGWLDGDKCEVEPLEGEKFHSVKEAFDAILKDIEAYLYSVCTKCL